MNKIDLEKLYQNYLNHYRKNQWNFEDIKFYLKKNKVDYEEYKFNEFCEKIKTDKKFYFRWGEEEVDPQERVCWNCLHVAKLIGLGQGLKCTNPLKAETPDVIQNKRHTCEMFESDKNKITN